MFLTGPHLFNLTLDAIFEGNVIHGLGNLGGKQPFENETTTTGDEFEQKRKLRVECRVRRGSVTVLLDGKQRIRWLGDLTRLQFDHPLWSVPDKTRLALGAQCGEYHIHECKLTPVGKAPANSVRAVPDPDRKAAEYALSIGGTVEVNGEGKQINAVADLPRVRFTLTAVGFDANQNVTDAGLASFKDCKNLTQLILKDTRVGDAGLAHFKDCKNLMTLNLQNTQVSDEGLGFFKDCKSLEKLHLTSSRNVTNRGLAHFKDCKNLTFLSIGDNGMVNDEGLAHFKDCKNLASFELAYTQVSDAGLAYFKDCKLTYLGVKGTNVTAPWIAEFAKAQPQCKIQHDGGTIEPTR